VPENTAFVQVALRLSRARRVDPFIFSDTSSYGRIPPSTTAWLGRCDMAAGRLRKAAKHGDLRGCLLTLEDGTVDPRCGCPFR
jgi:hypothetical protein